MGRDQINNTILDFSCHNTILLLGDEHTSRILTHLTFGRIPSFVVGSPRNEILQTIRTNVEQLKEKLNLPASKRIVLFAPTFRNDGTDVAKKNILRSGINQINMMDFDILFQTLSCKFDGDWTMVLRFHYHVDNLVDWEELQKKYPGKFVNGNTHDDMAEYLACTDVLITDISSCMFDFMTTNKPIFLFFPDILHYETIERGFYFPIEDLPFQLADDFPKLIDNIKSFDLEEYQKGIFHLMKKLEIRDPAGSSMKIAEIILQNM